MTQGYSFFKINTLVLSSSVLLMRALVPKWHTEKNMGSRENLWESGMEIIVGRLGIEVYAVNKKAYGSLSIAVTQ